MNPVLFNEPGLVAVKPCATVWVGTDSPPFDTNVTVYVCATHPAYNVVFSVIIVVNTNAFVHAASVYQPVNANPDLVGSAGWTTYSPNLIVWLATLDPPLELNVTLNVASSPPAGISMNLAVNVKLDVTLLVKSYALFPLYHPPKIYPSFVGSAGAVATEDPGTTSVWYVLPSTWYVTV